jgi:hypothetical protein
MNITEIEDLELAPIGDADIDTSSFYERIIERAKNAAKVENNAIAEANSLEADSLVRRIMGFISGRAKTKQKAVSVESAPAYPNIEEAGAPRLSDCSAVLRILLGRDYETPIITNPRYLRCLYQLMQAPYGFSIPREELDRLIEASNSPAYIDILRNKKLARYGDVIKTEMRQVTTRGKKTWRGFYWMTEIGRLIAQDVLARANYLHDEAAAQRHKHRQLIDRQRLIAAFGCDHDAKDIILDTTQPHWVRLLHLLLWTGGWISRYDIECLIDASNLPDVVMAINNWFGYKVIESETRTILDRDKKYRNAGYYRIPAECVAKTKAIFRAFMAQ